MITNTTNALVLQAWSVHYQFAEDGKMIDWSTVEHGTSQRDAEERVQRRHPEIKVIPRKEEVAA